MKEKRITTLLVTTIVAASVAATLVFATVVHQMKYAEARKEAQANRIQQSRSEEFNAQRKAQLVRRINRYWQLRDEAVRRGIDLTQVPTMPYLVGRDGNIYRLLPNGQRQMTPADFFHDPDDLYAQQWTNEQTQEIQKQRS